MSFEPTLAQVHPAGQASNGRSFAALAAQKQRAKWTEPTQASQVTTYLSSPFTDYVPDVLAYMQTNAIHLPGLAQMANDVLAVPISGVGVKGVISIACLVHNYIQKRLNPATIIKLMFIKHAERQPTDGTESTDDTETDDDETASKGEKEESDGDNGIAEKQVISDGEQEADGDADIGFVEI
jgi:hypothetical protein